MTFGGSATTRDRGLAKFVAIIFERLGLLNKGSASASAAPEPGKTGEVEPISSNTLNVTRVGGLTTLIGGAGAAALAIFNINKATDRSPIVVAAYASVGVIVAATVLTVAIIIAADIRARGAIAVATTPASAQQPTPTVKAVSSSFDTKVTLDRVYEYVLVDAEQGDVALTLPGAASGEWRSLTVKRTDAARAHTVTVQPVAGFYEDRLDLTLPRPTFSLYSTGKEWKMLA